MINRRKFLYTTGVGSLALLSNALLPPAVNAFALPAKSNTEKNEADLELIIKASPGKVPVFSGPRTDVWMYRGEVLKGDPTSIVNLSEESYLGPILRVKKGQRIRIHFQNALPVSSIIHWHGLHVPSDMDGHPRLAVPPGGQYTYEFQIVSHPKISFQQLQSISQK